VQDASDDASYIWLQVRHSTKSATITQSLTVAHS
jgi:hypothetical protein